MGWFNMMKPKMKTESSEERFKRIASKRTNRLLNELRLLGNCSNKGTYSYDEKQVNQIFSALEQETKRVKALFINNKKKRITL
jgi:hypothetical protein